MCLFWSGHPLASSSGVSLDMLSFWMFFFRISQINAERASQNFVYWPRTPGTPSHASAIKEKLWFHCLIVLGARPLAIVTPNSSNLATMTGSGLVKANLRPPYDNFKIRKSFPQA